MVATRFGCSEAQFPAPPFPTLVRLGLPSAHNVVPQSSLLQVSVVGKPRRIGVNGMVQVVLAISRDGGAL